MDKKILFVRTAPNEFNPNTYNVQGVGLGKAFCRLGYDFDFLSFSKKGREEYVLEEVNGHKITFISKPRIRVLRTSFCMEICKKDFLNQYSFIISCEYGQYMTYALSKTSDKVVMYSGPYYNMFFFPFMSKLYDSIFTCKINTKIKYKFVKSVLAKEFMESKGYNNVISVGVGLDMERFKNQVEIEDCTKKLADFMRANECLLYIGSLDERKNFPFLLKVFECIHNEDSTIKLVVIGKGKKKYVEGIFGKTSQEVKNSIYRMEQIDNSQLRYIYPLAKAFLLPSKLEIFGMVLLEAMYLGAPVVSSRNGGSLTLIKNGETGEIVEKFDAQAWCNAVMKYVNNPDYSASVRRNAQVLIEEQFTWDVIAEKMLETICE